MLSKYHKDEVDSEYIWKYQDISPSLKSRIEDIVLEVWNHFMNPVVKGINITQWCKKEECWVLLQKRYEQNIKRLSESV